IMMTTSCAAELGVFTRLASWIEPRTRGPVRHAFRMVFAIAAVTAAVLSNDAAILLVTPVVIELLRAVYPKRNPKFLVPFAFAAFDGPSWPVAGTAAITGMATVAHAQQRVGVRRVASGVSWELLPFLFGVLVLATALARAGATAELANLYARTPAPLATIGTVA